MSDPNAATVGVPAVWAEIAAMAAEWAAERAEILPDGSDAEPDWDRVQYSDDQAVLVLADIAEMLAARPVTTATTPELDDPLNPNATVGTDSETKEQGE